MLDTLQAHTGSTHTAIVENALAVYAALLEHGPSTPARAGKAPAATPMPAAPTPAPTASPAGAPPGHAPRAETPEDIHLSRQQRRTLQRQRAKGMKRGW